MLDSKMSGILSGVGSGNCQLCTASLKEFKDLEIVRTGFLINRKITDVKELFTLLDKDEYLDLPSSQRLGITHEPVSGLNVLPASPLHSYICVFGWFMLLVYHLNSGSLIWAPTYKDIETSKRVVSDFLVEKTGLWIDQPTRDGGSFFTGNIAR